MRKKEGKSRDRREMASNVAYVAQKLLTSNVLNGLRGPAAVASSRIINTAFRRAYHTTTTTTNNNSIKNNGVANAPSPAANVPSPPAADDSFSYGIWDVVKQFSATTTNRLIWAFKKRKPCEYQFHPFHTRHYGFSDVLKRFSATTTNRLTRVLMTPSTTFLEHPFCATIYHDRDEVYVQFLWVVPEGVKVCVINNQDNTTSIFMEAQGREKLKLELPGFKNYNSWIDLPDNHGYNINDIKAEFQSITGNLKLIFPKLKQDDEYNKFEQQQETSIRNVKVDIDNRPLLVRVVIYGKEYYKVLNKGI